jgi:hypothetical protein
MGVVHLWVLGHSNQVFVILYEILFLIFYEMLLKAVNIQCEILLLWFS